MVVCICKGVRDREIHQAIGEGANTLAKIGDRCRAGTGCGRCRNRLECMLTRKGAEASERHSLEIVSEAG